jgi:hypothetical protein
MEKEFPTITCKIWTDKEVTFEPKSTKNVPLKLSLSDSKISQVSKEELKRKEECSKELECDAIFGLVDLLVNKYLILVTASQMEGYVLPGKSVRRATRIEMIPIGSHEPVELSRNKKDSSFKELLQKVFDTETFYFSNEYDLTNSMQEITQNPELPPNSSFYMNECKLGFKF